MGIKIKNTIIIILQILFYICLFISLLFFIAFILGEESEFEVVLGGLVISSFFGMPYIILKYFTKSSKQNNTKLNNIICPNCGAKIQKKCKKESYIKCDYCSNNFWID
ncbi:hypothetical protein [Candidatus Vampirococcus lugosii]|uniref:Zn-finger containing protein n=1 Tax=Candidatus Vampirococcus lugosii TaxID=2789015 RepID=A0ABS5QLI7_9BACT|nr:hypothetical protein [Candidatus Vampirococcus lugosii]MBS8122065.1 hypothetical protein [Candidatus Vampirococcus lugosii]